MALPPDHPRAIEQAAARAKGLCGKSYSYRRTMYELPEWRVCSLTAGHPKRHGQAKIEVERDEPAGTCQICFRTQQTNNGNLVKHGYKRPGWGYTIGECWGCRFQPFEVSCERTKAFIAEKLKPTLLHFEVHLRVLQQNPPATLTHEGRVWVGHQKAKSGYQGVSIKVAKGEPHGWKKTDLVAIMRHHWAAGPIVEVGDFEQISHPSYADLLKRQIQDTESRIRMVKADIASYEKKVAEWKPVPWPVLKAVA